MLIFLARGRACSPWLLRAVLSSSSTSLHHFSPVAALAPASRIHDGLFLARVADSKNRGGRGGKLNERKGKAKTAENGKETSGGSPNDEEDPSEKRTKEIIRLTLELMRLPSSKRREEINRRLKEIAQEHDRDAGGNKSMKQMMSRLKRIFAVALFIFGVSYMMNPMNSEVAPAGVSDINWSDFINKLLPTGQISRIIVFPERDLAYVYLYDGARTLQGEPLDAMYRLTLPSVPRFEAEVRAAEAALQLPPEHWTQIQYRRLEGLSNTMTFVLVGVICIAVFLFFRKMTKSMSSFSISDLMVSRSKLNIIDPSLAEDKAKLKIKFKDVAGLHEAKVEISEFVDYLNKPEKYTRLGAKLPKGALLTGPPGCGKTLLAKALAAESSAPFISMNGTEFVEMIGGLGASRIRDLFKEAKKRAPCIVYIDEVDAVGRKRGGGKGGGMGGENSEAEQTLNQLLVEMDGMDSAQGIIILASTNRPDILDKALLRPGRFDRHISIDLPTVLERAEMFELYLKKIKLNSTVPAAINQRLANMTPGFSGADIANVVNEAAIRAVSTGKKSVDLKHFEHAMDRVLAGAEKRSRTLVEEERVTVAYHEAGHALVGWMLEHTDALLKVTIIPRTIAALGFAQYSPKDKKLYSKEELFDRMCMMLGGRVAEAIKFNRVTTGAEDDLKKVTRTASAQVREYGMSSLLGPLSFSSQNSEFMKKPYSGRLQNVIDDETSQLVSKAYYATDKLLRDHADKLELLALELLKHEVLTYEDVRKLLGPPPFGEKTLLQVVDQVLPQAEQS